MFFKLAFQDFTSSQAFVGLAPSLPITLSSSKRIEKKTSSKKWISSIWKEEKLIFLKKADDFDSGFPIEVYSTLLAKCLVSFINLTLYLAP